MMYHVSFIAATLETVQESYLEGSESQLKDQPLPLADVLR